MTATIGRIEEQYLHWTDFLLQSDAGSHEIAARVDGYRQKWGVPLDFWAGPSFRRVGFEFPAFVWKRPDSFGETSFSAYIDENVPCGPMLTMFVKRLPASGEEAVFSANDVYEIDEQGETIRQWKTPRDSTVISVRGAELLVPYVLNPVCASASSWSTHPVRVDLAMLPSGRFRVVSAHEEAARSKPDECGEVPALKTSADFRCEIFRDLATGKPRRIASEAPCT